MRISAQVEDAVLARIQAVLEQGGAARSVEITAEEDGMIKPLGLLTAKPIIYATNVSEDDLADGNAYCSEVIALAEQEGLKRCVFQRKWKRNLWNLATKNGPTISKA